MIFVLPAAFYSSLLLVARFIPSVKGLREQLLASALISATVALTIAEFTSAIGKLDSFSVLLAWMAWTIFGFSFFKAQQLTLHWKSMLAAWKTNKNSVRLFGILLLTILSLLLLQALSYPPNNWDSMTYHMARIPHWLNNASLEHFATHIYRQLYQPPLSEIMIAHTILLHGSDLFANFVQFFFYCATLLAVSLLARELGLSPRMQWMSTLLAALLPEAILQASSTQNDLVLSFFVLSCSFFVLKKLQAARTSYLLFAFLSGGLALMTKGTGYIFIAPILAILVFHEIRHTLQSTKSTKLSPFLLAIILFATPQIGHFYRNYSLVGHPLGMVSGMRDAYKNKELSPPTLLSNLLRNISLHLGPWPLSNWSESSVRTLHEWTGADPDDPQRSYGATTFSVPNRPNHEDKAPNPLHVLLGFLALSLSLWHLAKRRQLPAKISLILVAIVFIQVLFFCLYLKWQPWHSRLHVPIFLLSTPLVIQALTAGQGRILKASLTIALLYGFAVLIFNYSRPLLSLQPLTSQVSLFDSREKKTFANRADLKEDYHKILKKLHSLSLHRVGLVISQDTWEYPLFNTFGKGRLVPIHILPGASNPSKTLFNSCSNDIQAIVSNERRKSFVCSNRVFRPEYTSNSLSLYFPDNQSFRNTQ